MVSQDPGTETGPYDPVFSCLAVEPRRIVLAALLESAPQSESALAAVVASPAAEPASEATVRGTLVHVHLPAMADAGLIEWNPETGTVEPTTHPALSDPRFGGLLGLDADDLDAVFGALVHIHRRFVLAELRETGRTMTRDDLADAIRRRLSVGADSIDEIATSLHHAQLPKLAAVGLIGYDATTGRARYADHSTLEAVLEQLTAPDDDLVERYDGFLGGLHEARPQVGRDAGDCVGWPPSWGDPNFG